MRRGLLLLSTVLIALAVVPAAIANKPTGSGDVLLPDQCAFPVLAHIDGGEIDKTFFDKKGNVKLLGVFPGQTSTWTNLETGTSITVSDAGSTHQWFAADGSAKAVINGHGPIPNFVTGEPGLWYLAGGQITLTGDASGNLTSVDVRGSLVDLCSRLTP
jgi:hypothetical protein